MPGRSQVREMESEEKRIKKNAESAEAAEKKEIEKRKRRPTLKNQGWGTRCDFLCSAATGRRMERRRWRWLPGAPGIFVQLVAR